MKLKKNVQEHLKLMAIKQAKIKSLALEKLKLALTGTITTMEQHTE